MANFRTLTSATGLLVALTLAGCGSMNTPYNTGASGPTYYPPATTSGAPYAQYGVVQSIELVRQDNSGIGAGTIVGAVIGGIVGNQVGGGRGNTAATVIGAAGGAYAGHEIEKAKPATIRGLQADHPHAGWKHPDFDADRHWGYSGWRPRCG